MHSISTIHLSKKPTLPTSTQPHPQLSDTHHTMRQHPTLQNVWIRSTRDALQIFYAVARSVLPKVERRLDTDERRAIAPGNVYVWEERGASLDSTGLSMERWTDGLNWGPSRVRDEFLFYQEKDVDPRDDAGDPSTRWARNVQRRPSGSGIPVAPEPLVKQTYSVTVNLPGDTPGTSRKWHLTAYFTQSAIDNLYTVDDFPEVGRQRVPNGMFASARVGNRTAKRRSAEKARRESADAVPVPTGSSPTSPVAIAPAPESRHRSNSSASSTTLASVRSPRTHPYYPIPASRPALVSGHASSAPPMYRAQSTSPTPSLGSVSTPAPGGWDREPPPQLAPLAYLEGLRSVPRNPIDDYALQSFSRTSA